LIPLENTALSLNQTVLYLLFFYKRAPPLPGPFNMTLGGPQRQYRFRGDRTLDTRYQDTLRVSNLSTRFIIVKPVDPNILFNWSFISRYTRVCWLLMGCLELLKHQNGLSVQLKWQINVSHKDKFFYGS